MSVTLVLPGQLREVEGVGGGTLVLPGEVRSVRDALDRLGELHPYLHSRLVTETRELRPHLNLFVQGENIRWSGGLETPVEGGDEIVVLPSVSGG